MGQGVFNLSTQALTQAELSVLDKGLKHAPPKKLDKFNTFIDIHKYIRKINTQRYLPSNPYRTNQAATSGAVHSGLSNPSLFSPPVPVAPAVKIFRDLVLEDLAKLPEKHVPPTSVERWTQVLV